MSVLSSGVKGGQYMRLFASRKDFYYLRVVVTGVTQPLLIYALFPAPAAQFSALLVVVLRTLPLAVLFAKVAHKDFLKI
jgi:hypothetical protein